MHELRKDPIQNRWVAVLKDSMPPAFYLSNSIELTSKNIIDESNCILCQGREDKIPKDIFAIREQQSNTSNWLTRVIPSPNPIFQIEGGLGRKGVGMYDKMNSIGANEIIIESPQHNTPPEDMGIDQMIRVIVTYKHRISELEKDPRLRYTFIYKDCGKTASDLYHHPHSRIIATPVIPKGIKEELNGAKAYYQYKERCIFCDIINEELRTGNRIIMETNYFIAFSPFAPRSPFEYWIMPRRHNCAFNDINNEELEDLSLTLMTTVKKVKNIFKNPPYSYVIHSAPNRMPRKNHWHTVGEDYHWHIEVKPNIARPSSFELDSELYILTTSPEDAAKYLREV